MGIVSSQRLTYQENSTFASCPQFRGLSVVVIHSQREQVTYHASGQRIPSHPAPLSTHEDRTSAQLCGATLHQWKTMVEAMLLDAFALTILLLVRGLVEQPLRVEQYGHSSG